MGKVKKGKDSAKNSYSDAVDLLVSIAGADWGGPKRSKKEVNDALDSTKDLDTDELRKRSDGLKKKSGLAVIIGLILKEILEGIGSELGKELFRGMSRKAREFFDKEDQDDKVGKQVGECADTVDKIVIHTTEVTIEVCGTTETQIRMYCETLKQIDKNEFPEQYHLVLCAADDLINSCGTTVIEITKEQDRCISESYNIILDHGNRVCGLPFTEVPPICDAPTGPYGIDLTPDQCDMPPQVPECEPEPESKPEPVPETRPEPTPGPEPHREPTPEPVPNPVGGQPNANPAPQPEVRTDAEPVTPQNAPVGKPGPSPTEYSLTPPETSPQTVTPEPTVPETKEPAEFKKPSAPTQSQQQCDNQPVQECPEKAIEEATDPALPETSCVPTAGFEHQLIGGVVAVAGIGVMIGVLGALVLAAEEALADPVWPAPPLPETPIVEEPTVPAPAPEACEPPPPPKQNVPEPPPPPKQNVPEPPPPPKQDVPEPPPPPKQNVPEPPPPPKQNGMEQASVRLSKPVGEPVSVSSPSTRKGGAW